MKLQAPNPKESKRRHRILSALDPQAAIDRTLSSELWAYNWILIMDTNFEFLFGFVNMERDCDFQLFPEKQQGDCQARQQFASFAGERVNKRIKRDTFHLWAELQMKETGDENLKLIQLPNKCQISEPVNHATCDYVV